MSEIRAFVGHSFNEEDADLVRAFLDYFDQLQLSMPSFSWQHAKPAEPKELAEKVLALLDDKNVFIGICTRKERVIDPRRLRKSFWRSGSLHADSEEFQWKTTDWIIQEIGLACGRGMDLVLLVEAGVRSPGGLQGNVEYIPFDRAAPEKSFGKILEMLGSLTPKLAPLGNAEASTAPPVGESEQQKAESSSNEEIVPQVGWKRQDYEFALLRASALDDASMIETLDKAYQATESGALADNVASWQAYRIYLRILFGKGASLLELREFASRHMDNHHVLRRLAHALEYYKNYIDAAKTLELAASKVGDTSTRLGYLREACADYKAAGKTELAAKLLGCMRDIGGVSQVGEQDVLEAQKDVAEATGDHELILACLERLVDLSPDDADKRFALAYKHSELGNEQLAFFHYSRIPSHERSDMTWNNLGVSLELLDMPGRSVDAYRTASDMGNTLAMSNLANRFMKGGFLAEARSLCEKAFQLKDFHKNIGVSDSRLKEIPEEEDRKEKDANNRASPVSEFYRFFGKQMVNRLPAKIPSKWRGPDCDLALTSTETSIQLAGEFERRSLSRLSRGFLGAPTGGEKSSERFRLQYLGKSFGCAFLGTVTRVRVDTEADAPSLLAPSENTTAVLLYLGDDLATIQVMERNAGKEFRRYQLTLVDD